MKGAEKKGGEKKGKRLNSELAINPRLPTFITLLPISCVQNVKWWIDCGCLSKISNMYFVRFWLYRVGYRAAEVFEPAKKGGKIFRFKQISAPLSQRQRGSQADWKQKYLIVEKSSHTALAGRVTTALTMHYIPACFNGKALACNVKKMFKQTFFFSSLFSCNTNESINKGRTESCIKHKWKENCSASS